MTMPGVDAFHVELTDGNGSLASLIQAADFDSAVLHSLGTIVPGDAGAGTGAAPGGIYSLDVTAALNDAVAGSGSYFPVRLQLGGDTTGKPLDANVNIDYVFNHAAHGGNPMGAPYIEYTLIPEPATMLLLVSGSLALIRRKHRAA